MMDASTAIEAIHKLRDAGDADAPDKGSYDAGIGMGLVIAAMVVCELDGHRLRGVDDTPLDQCMRCNEVL